MASQHSSPSETTPLLRRPHRQLYSSLWLSELWFLTKSSVPIMLAYMLQNSLQTVSVLIVGRLSPEALATAAFAYMFAMATAWLIALGGTTALDTLASSSFTGAKSKHDLGILLQRAIAVLTAFYGVAAVIWCFSGSIFRALGQPDFICTQSARFLQLLIPGGLGYVYFECLKKYLQAQGISAAGTWALLVSSPLNAILNYIFIYKLELGLDGAPLATGISYWISAALLVLYAAFVKGADCWGGFSWHALQHMRPFAKLAILGIVHVGTEWWAFEIVAIAAGRLGTIPLAAQSVIMTADQIINTIPFGLGVSASSRLGNLLGADNPVAARRTAHSAAILSVIFGTLILVTLLAARHSVGSLFNSDERVIELVAEIMPYVALFQIADGLNGSCGGTLRGMGRQWVGAVVNCVSYYGAALPVGIYMAFHGWGLSGLWFGQCAALFLVGMAEWWIVGMSDWANQVERAAERLGQSGIVRNGHLPT